MRINGTIRVKFASCFPETNLDEDGNPIASTEEWSCEMPACVQIISEHRRADYEDGRYRAATYNVHIEVPCKHPFSPTQVKLKRHGQDLGEFSVISCQLLPSVGRIEIVI